MSILRFTDGEAFNTEGPYRTEAREDGWYVVGHGSLIPVRSEEEGEQLILILSENK